MKRSEFLKKLGTGLGVAVVAPEVFAENTPNRDIELSKYLIEKNYNDVLNIPKEILFKGETFSLTTAW